MGERRTLEVDRRQFTKLVSSGAILGLAGCTGDGDDPTTDTSGGDTTTTTESSGGDTTTAEGTTEEAVRAGYYDHLRVAYYIEPTTLDPYYENLNRNELNLQLHFYDHLLTRQQSDMEIVPQLVREYEPVDQTHWNMTLAEGVTFHNGEELTAETVAGSVDLMQNEEYSPGLANQVSGISEVNPQGDYEMEVVTDGPLPTLLARLTTYPLVVHPDWYESTSGEERARNPMGTGPFTLEEWSSGNQIVLNRFDDYWKGTPSIERITFNIVPEDSTRVSGLQSGDVHLATKVPPSQTEEVDGADELEITGAPSARIQWFQFNREKEEAFENQNVRLAANYAIDIDAIVDDLLLGYGEPVGQGVPEYFFGYNPDVDPFPYDPEQAQSLMEEAGYGDGFSTTLRTDPEHEEFSRAVAGYLRQVGIDPDVEVVEASTKYSRFLDGDAAPIEYEDWGNWSLFDSAGTFPFIFHTDGNWSYTSWPELDEITDEATTTVDEDERRQLYHEANKMVHDRAALIFGFAQYDIHGKVAEFDEFAARSDNLVRFKYVQDE